MSTTVHYSNPITLIHSSIPHQGITDIIQISVQYGGPTVLTFSNGSTIELPDPEGWVVEGSNIKDYK